MMAITWPVQNETLVDQLKKYSHLLLPHRKQKSKLIHKLINDDV